MYMLSCIGRLVLTSWVDHIGQGVSTFASICFLWACAQGTSGSLCKPMHHETYGSVHSVMLTILIEGSATLYTTCSFCFVLARLAPVLPILWQGRGSRGLNTSKALTFAVESKTEQPARQREAASWKFLGKQTATSAAVCQLGSVIDADESHHDLVPLYM